MLARREAVRAQQRRAWAAPRASRSEAVLVVPDLRLKRVCLLAELAELQGQCAALARSHQDKAAEVKQLQVVKQPVCRLLIQHQAPAVQWGPRPYCTEIPLRMRTVSPWMMLRGCK